MFKKHGEFDIVGNFSAHKHVRSEKDIYSVEALLQNNVIHAKRLLDLLSAYPPEEYFCVSTDKAANPVNIMGASKRIMEDLIFSYSDRFQLNSKICKCGVFKWIIAGRLFGKDAETSADKCTIRC